MTFDFLDDTTWVPDHVEWAEFNKKNLVARKEEWKQIQPSLKELARIKRTPSGYITVHKSLFFKGCLPKSEKELIAEEAQISGYGCGSKKLFFSFPLLYFWYHPNLTNQCIEQLFKRFTTSPLAVEFRGEITSTAIQNCKSLFFQLQSMNRPYGDYGIMGGREELLAPYFLFGSESGTSENAHRTGWFNPTCGYLLKQMMPGLRVLEGKYNDPKLGLMYRGNPFGTGQYVWPQVSHYIQRHYLDVIADPEKQNISMELQFVENMIQKVLFHGEWPKTETDDPLALACRDRILGQYRNGELAEWLSERFARREKLGMEAL